MDYKSKISHIKSGEITVTNTSSSTMDITNFQSPKPILIISSDSNIETKGYLLRSNKRLANEHIVDAGHTNEYRKDTSKG